MGERDFGYRQLVVWQKAMAFSVKVYALVRKFPPEEKFALSDQVRRAVVSVASNIAEGCGRSSDRDYAHFLAVARGSLYETMTQLEMAQNLGYLDSLENVEPLAKEIARILGALMRKYGAIVRKSSASPSPSTSTSPSHLPLPSTSPSHFD